jgi:hypothetical protein
VGPGGEALARGPYGADAEALIVVPVELREPRAAGAGIVPMLRAKGYRGP